ncbi:FAD-dependent oxidoreductase [Aliiglaciecola sp. CAU 1673]|uniref:FAD-dependent oxidoreductase n=1 Tax=Aliiglaciecola sp. CAU 1673 TaxID=3032595 RepID=UPI0023D9A478|nr:FAD-dependent oxidoreductase [Aliiglaciecola sp. CAU 1673]MDF2179937.1 FAD-dependent oxidoreductase [Aliiglaciecola sp. CAU 1673]
MIKNLLPCALLVLVSACGSNKQSSDLPAPNESASTPFIVIGAGIAGLAAAKTLHKAGNPVVVLEARDRIGGRMYSDRSLGDTALDMGASWIHGTEDNPIHKLAESLQLPMQETDYDNALLYDSNGEQNAALYQDLTRLEEALESHLTTLAFIHPDGPVKQAFDRIKDDSGTADIPQKVVDYVASANIEHDAAADIEDLSLWALMEGESFEGPEVLFPEGYDRITEHLATGLDIRLNQVVQSIDYSQGAVLITTQDGNTFNAQKVIITLPLGVLKSDKVRFNPILPKEKREAIAAMGMGLLNKLYLKFDQVFWDPNVDAIGYVSSEKGRWNDWLNLAKYTGEPMLMAFSGGRVADAIERQSDEEIIEQAMAALSTIYKDKTLQPTDYRITRWRQDPYALGAYSYMKVGANPDMREDLAESLQNMLYFAGEATHSDYPATVHGAYLSGLREAQKVLADAN